MRFLIDADVPRSITKSLTSMGHDVVDIRDVRPSATADTSIYKLLKEQI